MAETTERPFKRIGDIYYASITRRPLAPLMIIFCPHFVIIILIVSVIPRKRHGACFQARLRWRFFC